MPLNECLCLFSCHSCDDNLHNKSVDVNTRMSCPFGHELLCVHASFAILKRDLSLITDLKLVSRLKPAFSISNLIAKLKRALKSQSSI